MFFFFVHSIKSPFANIQTFVGEYLKNRTYRGLEANVGQDEAAEIQEGLSGIARGYVNEKEDDQK